VAVAAADILATAAAARPDLSLGLPTGRTAIPWYGELARRHQEGKIDLSRARSFNLDELLLPAGHAGRFDTFMRQHSWEKIGLLRGRYDIPDPSAEPMAECRRYDRVLAAAGPLDLVFIGVGEDGHVAYNLAGQVAEETHLVKLPDALAESLEVPEKERPLGAITAGLGMMRRARHLVLLATDAAKAVAIRALVDGPENPAWPCSLLRSHPHFDLLLTGCAMQSDESPRHDLSQSYSANKEIA
jgi:glucosamine-6-phosphate deaminase